MHRYQGSIGDFRVHDKQPYLAPFPAGWAVAGAVSLATAAAAIAGAAIRAGAGAGKGDEASLMLETSDAVGDAAGHGVQIRDRTPLRRDRGMKKW